MLGLGLNLVLGTAVRVLCYRMIKPLRQISAYKKLKLRIPVVLSGWLVYTKLHWVGQYNNIYLKSTWPLSLINKDMQAFQLTCASWYGKQTWRAHKHTCHDDVIKMETFSSAMALCEGNPPFTGKFPSQSQWCGALMFSLMSAWTNGCENNREAGDLKQHRAHYDITVMCV